MAKRKLYNVAFRRQRKGKTDYKKRLKLLLGDKPRLIVRTSLKRMYSQIVEYDEKGDKTILNVSSYNLKKYGWNAGFSNLPSAYLTGLLVGKNAVKKGIKELIPDIGLNKSIKGGKIYALLKGVIDIGVKVPCSEDIFPDENRIKGEHIRKYAEDLSKEQEKFKKVFSEYIKENFDPLKIKENFDIVKNKILGEK